MGNLISVPGTAGEGEEAGTSRKTSWPQDWSVRQVSGCPQEGAHSEVYQQTPVGRAPTVLGHAWKWH